MLYCNYITALYVQSYMHALASAQIEQRWSECILQGRNYHLGPHWGQFCPVYGIDENLMLAPVQLLLFYCFCNLEINTSMVIRPELVLQSLATSIYLG